MAKGPTPAGGIVQFVMFCSNHPGMDKVLNEVFGAHLGQHFSDKLTGIQAGDRVCRPEHIMKLMKEMTIDNQLKLATYICDVWRG